MRKKYKDELSDEFNKKKIPHFFAHISRQKGYYSPQKKSYYKYNTSMDYLQTIINSFRIKNPYRKDYLPFVSVLNNALYRTSNINLKQIEKIYAMLNTYIYDRKNIFASNLDKRDKYIKSKLAYETLITDIESESIGFSTLFYLLSFLENKENIQIKNVLLPILFSRDNENFKKAIIDSCAGVRQLEYDGNDLRLFGIDFKITKKEINSEMRR